MLAADTRRSDLRWPVTHCRACPARHSQRSRPAHHPQTKHAFRSRPPHWRSARRRGEPRRQGHHQLLGCSGSTVCGPQAIAPGGPRGKADRQRTRSLLSSPGPANLSMPNMVLIAWIIGCRSSSRLAMKADDPAGRALSPRNLSRCGLASRRFRSVRDAFIRRRCTPVCSLRSILSTPTWDHPAPRSVSPSPPRSSRAWFFRQRRCPLVDAEFG